MDKAFHLQMKQSFLNFSSKISFFEVNTERLIFLDYDLEEGEIGGEGRNFWKGAERQVACMSSPCISRCSPLLSLSLFNLPSYSFSLAGATCALRNSSFISRVLCSAAAVRPKKFLSRPSARLLSIPPFPLSRTLPPSSRYRT